MSSRESDEMRAQAREKHMAGDTPGAIVLLTEAIRKDPGNIRVAANTPGQAQAWRRRLASLLNE